MSLLEEAYARVRPGRMFLHALEIQHSGIDGEIRVIAPCEQDVSLPPAAGEDPVLWRAVPFRVVLPEQKTKEGSGQGQIILDMIADEIRSAIEDLASTGEPATLIYREYEVVFIAGEPRFDLITAPTQTFGGLVVREIEPGPASASAAVSYRDLSDLSVPRLTYDSETYPALHGI